MPTPRLLPQAPKRPVRPLLPMNHRSEACFVSTHPLICAYRLSHHIAKLPCPCPHRPHRATEIVRAGGDCYQRRPKGGVATCICPLLYSVRHGSSVEIRSRCQRYRCRLHNKCAVLGLSTTASRAYRCVRPSMSMYLQQRPFLSTGVRVRVTLPDFLPCTCR